MQRELRALAAVKRSEKAVAAAAKAAEAREAAAKAPPTAASSAEVVCEDVDSEGEGEDGVSDRDKMTENTPETRVEVGTHA